MGRPSTEIPEVTGRAGSGRDWVVLGRSRPRDAGDGAEPTGATVGRGSEPERQDPPTIASAATGTASADGYAEAAYTFDVATRLAGILRTAGARVVLTRTDNNGWGPCIDERAAIANRAGADVALSIHADGGPSSGRGFHVIYPPSLPGLTDDIAAASRRLALDVRAAYAQGTGVPYATYIGVDGLDQRRDLGGLNLSDVPKVFIETGNMGNATDARLIEDPAFRDRVARALMMGIRAFVDGR